MFDLRSFMSCGYMNNACNIVNIDATLTNLHKEAFYNCTS